jgi:tetratricopeptide (TPR) repeat protein
MDIYRECLQTYQDAGDRWGTANAYSTWASLMMQREYDPDLAAHLYRQAASIYREFGDTIGLAGSLNDLSFTRYWVGEYIEAREIILEVKAMLEKLDNPWSMVWLRETLGQIEVDLGNYESAINTYMENMPFLLEMGQRYLVALHYDCIGYVEFLRQDYVKAEDYARQALEIYRKLGNSNGTGMALNNLGDSLVAVSKFDEAEPLYKEALEIFTGSSNYWALAKTHKNLGRLYFMKGDRYSSKEYYRTGFGYGLESNRLAEVLEMLYGLAQLDAAEGDLEEALEKLAQVISHKAATTDVHNAAKKFLEEIETTLQQTMDSERICELKTRGQEKDLGEWLSE